MSVFELWLQKEGCLTDHASGLARMLQEGLTWNEMWQQRHAWGGGALTQLWRWRRLYDTYRQLQTHLQNCNASFLPFITDTLAIRISAVAPSFAASNPQHFLETVRVLVNMYMSRSNVRCIATNPPVHKDFEDLLSLHEPPETLPSHRVLCVLRAQKANAIQLKIEVPFEEITQQWELRKNHQWPQQPAFFDQLPNIVWEEMVLRAQMHAVETAAEVFRGLLTTKGLDVSQGALGVYIGAPHQQAGAVYLDKHGKFAEQVGFSADTKGFVQLCTWCAAHPDIPIVLPATAPDTVRLQRLRRELSGRVVSAVRPAALSWSRQQLSAKLPSHVASARILLERARDPFMAFAHIPAWRLGVAEYQPEIPNSLLQSAFSDMVAWVQFQRESATSSLHLASSERFLPGMLVQTMADLRPGMQILGMITSIVPFGVFVNLGLEVDGLIHVSELPDTFKQNITNHLQLGQRVLCRVLHVDMENKRISLSLRPTTPHVPPRRGQQTQLQKLNSLFRK